MKLFYEIADIVYSNTNIATDADDVATMSIESEGNFNPAMVNMLRGADGVISLRNNKDSFNEVETSLAQCKEKIDFCNTSRDGWDCCEYK